MKIKVVMDILVPKPPNFLRTTNNNTFPISTFSDDQLMELGDVWTQNLIENAREQRREEKRK